MNKQTAKEYLPLIQAMADGKVIEMCDDKYENWLTLSELNFTGPSSQYRIKQSLSLRPWKPEEVPVGALIRGSCYGIRVIQGYGPCKDGGNSKYVQYLNNFGDLTGDGLQICFDSREHSTDQGKTWLPCGVPI